MSTARYTPLYRWLQDILRDQISRGTYHPGDALPTEHELMRRYKLSITTVRRAMHDLARDGWLYRQAGKGTFVKRARMEERLSRLTSFAEEMSLRNIVPTFRLVRAEFVVPPAAVGRALGLRPREKAYRLERVQLADGEPIALARGYWIAEIGERLAQADLNRVALYDVAEGVCHTDLVEADESISASAADAEIARALRVPHRAPLLVRRRVTHTTAMRPVEYTTTFYRADRYEYTIRLIRRSGR